MKNGKAKERRLVSSGGEKSRERERQTEKERESEGEAEGNEICES